MLPSPAHRRLHPVLTRSSAPTPNGFARRLDHAWAGFHG